MEKIYIITKEGYKESIGIKFIFDNNTLVSKKSRHFAMNEQIEEEIKLLNLPVYKIPNGKKKLALNVASPNKLRCYCFDVKATIDENLQGPQFYKLNYLGFSKTHPDYIDKHINTLLENDLAPKTKKIKTLSTLSIKNNQLVK